jgi:hypothetical protein
MILQSIVVGFWWKITYCVYTWKNWTTKLTKSDETDLTTMLLFILITPLREKQYIMALKG